MLLANGIHYTKSGKGKAIIFLHGQGLNATIFSNTIKELSSYCCYAMDIRGHGKSVDSKNVTLEEFLQDILELMQQEKIKKAVLVGHSFGSFLALHFAKTYPNLVSQLILVNEVHRVSLRTIHGLFLGVIIPLCKIIDEMLVLTHTRYRQIDFSTHQYSSRVKLLFLGEMAQKRYVLKNTVPAMRNNPIDPNLVKTPVLILEPTRDEVINRHSYRELAMLLPKAKLIELSGGHFFPIRHPHELATWIKKTV